MSSAAWQSILILPLMLGIYGLAMGFFRRRDRRRARFAKLRMSSLTGPNAGVVLAALAISQLYYSFSANASSTAGLWLFLASVGAIVIVVGLHRRGERLVELLGVGAFVMTVFVREGPVVWPRLFDWCGRVAHHSVLGPVPLREIGLLPELRGSESMPIHAVLQDHDRDSPGSRLTRTPTSSTGR